MSACSVLGLNCVRKKLPKGSRTGKITRPLAVLMVRPSTKSKLPSPMERPWLSICRSPRGLSWSKTKIRRSWILRVLIPSCRAGLSIPVISSRYTIRSWKLLCVTCVAPRGQIFFIIKFHIGKSVRMVEGRSIFKNTTSS